MENDDFPQLIYYSTTELHCSKISNTWICSLSAVIPIAILEIQVVFFFFFRILEIPTIYQIRIDNNIINEIVRIIYVLVHNTIMFTCMLVNQHEAAARYTDIRSNNTSKKRLEFEIKTFCSVKKTLT